MLVNESMRALLADIDLADVTDADMPATFAQAIADGWERLDDGAVVLRALRRSYHGFRSAFTDLTGYEAAVNGRAVPDHDLPGHGLERVDKLVRRAYSFATAALRKVGELPQRPDVNALFLVTVTATDDPIYVGSVTFWAHHERERPYADPDNFITDVAAMLL